MRPFLGASYSPSDSEVAHPTGFEPASPNPQSWCFFGYHSSTLLLSGSLATVMPWKAIDRFAGVPEVRVAAI